MLVLGTGFFLGPTKERSFIQDVQERDTGLSRDVGPQSLVLGAVVILILYFFILVLVSSSSHLQLYILINIKDCALPNDS